ncbi:MAG: hypothetical protein ACC652_12130 [Acidimicrobiales bacterium]
MSSVLLALLVLFLVGGVLFVISRRRRPTIERGIKNFSREMQALAPRHPSMGPPRRRPSSPETKDTKKSETPAVDPITDDQPEAEA